MKLVPLTIEALGPLAFPERKPGVQFRTSLPYVPGATIYGALGMLIGEQLKPDDFATLFRQIRCHNAYPALDGDAWSRPLPMTAIHPKGGKEIGARYPEHNGKPGRLHRPYDDSLYARVCWEQQEPSAFIYAPTDQDGRPWEAVGRAFYTLERDEYIPWKPDDQIETAGFTTREVTQRVLTRVAINRRRGTAEDTRLYSPLVISEVMEDRDKPQVEKRDKQLVQTRFLGSIGIPDGDENILQALAEITHIGGRQTTGLGAVMIELHAEAVLEDDVTSIKNRVAMMTERFQKQSKLYEQLGGSSWQPDTIFTINLLSDAILLDQGWLPTNELNDAMLAEITGINAQLIRSFTTTSIVGGWNVSWQRPKPTAVAANMGSVFVFHINGKLSDDNYKQLAQLERDGIGERRGEGYGQIRICDEFHLLSEEGL